MKKLIATAALSLGLCAASIGQGFIDFGPKIGFGETLLLNSEASFNSDKYLHNPASVGFSGGFKLAYDFNRNFAIVAEIMYTSFTQKFDMTGTMDDSLGTEFYYDKAIKASMLEFPIMARVNTNGMQYFEAGYAFTKILGVTETNTGEGPVVPDVSDKYATNGGGLILGAGGYMWGSGNFGISAGLRFRYDIQNYVADNNRFADSPSFATDNEVADMTNYTSIMVVFEFNYDLGFYMAKSSCGSRQMIIGN